MSCLRKTNKALKGKVDSPNKVEQKKHKPKNEFSCAQCVFGHTKNQFNGSQNKK